MYCTSLDHYQKTQENDTENQPPEYFLSQKEASAIGRIGALAAAGRPLSSALRRSGKANLSRVLQENLRAGMTFSNHTDLKLANKTEKITGATT
jgi:hypothetical protein